MGVLRGEGGGQYPIFRLHVHVYVRPKGYGFTEIQSSNREYERFYFICMLLFNSNFPAHLLTADVCMCVCKGVCMFVCMYALLSLLILLLLFSLTSSSLSSSAGTRKVVSFFGEKELFIIHRYHLIVEM